MTVAGEHLISVDLSGDLNSDDWTATITNRGSFPIGLGRTAVRIVEPHHRRRGDQALVFIVGDQITALSPFA
jgi:hypothetical protein